MANANITLTISGISDITFESGKSVNDLVNDGTLTQEKPDSPLLGVVINDTLFDAGTAIISSGDAKLIFLQDEEAHTLIRHTCAHVMAQAVREHFPDAKLAIGPVIQDGYYYDIDVKDPFQPEDLKKIEKSMLKIIKGKHPMIRKVLDRQAALEFFSGDEYKEELISELPEGEDITTYTQDSFTDL